MKNTVIFVCLLSIISMITACTAPYQTIHALQQPSPDLITNTGAQFNQPRYSDKISLYPRADPKFHRNVILLPRLENEGNLKIELLIGLYMKTGCTDFQLSGSFVKRTLYGWGYPYYELSKIKTPISMLAACLDESRTQTFLRVANTDIVQPYNSDIPIVVYAPSGIEVKYLIWKSTGIIESSSVQ